MAVTKTIEIGRIEVVGQFKNVQIRTDTVWRDNGIELSRTHHRKSIDPCRLGESKARIDTDVSQEDPKVQEVCNRIWTEQVKSTYHDWLVSKHDEMKQGDVPR